MSESTAVVIVLAVTFLLGAVIGANVALHFANRRFLPPPSPKLTRRELNEMENRSENR